MGQEKGNAQERKINEPKKRNKLMGVKHMLALLRKVSKECDELGGRGGGVYINGVRKKR